MIRGSRRGCWWSSVRCATDWSYVARTINIGKRGVLVRITIVYVVALMCFVNPPLLWNFQPQPAGHEVSCDDPLKVCFICWMKWFGAMSRLIWGLWWQLWCVKFFQVPFICCLSVPTSLPVHHHSPLTPLLKISILSTQPSKIQTCAKNANQHPGYIQRKPCQPAATDPMTKKACTEFTKAVKEVKAVAKLMDATHVSEFKKDEMVC